MVELLNIDCIEYMKGLPDNSFDIAIVDPPYGIGAGCDVARHKFKNNKKEWDISIPTKEYFDELFRVSKNQIIWGGNYFKLPQTQCFIVWDKKQPENFTLAMAEYAWTSFNKPAKIFRHSNKNDTNKIHPTQKPIQLYKWLFEKYVETGFKVLDTHLGSGSSAIVAEKKGIDFVGCEIDKDYFNEALKRYKKEIDLPLFKQII